MESNQKGLIIAELINKTTRKTKDDETFYTLEISIRKTLTEMVLELRKETIVQLPPKETLYVFSNRGKGNKYAYTLEIGCIYAFWFTKYQAGTKEDYFHVLDWRKLSADKRSIERTLRLVLLISPIGWSPWIRNDWPLTAIPPRPPRKDYDT